VSARSASAIAIGTSRSIVAGAKSGIDSGGSPTRRAPIDLIPVRSEQLKASVRAKVEHPFHVIKNLVRHKKVRYKGLAKNEAQLFSLFALANLVIRGG
jgi:hypothetical protein